MTKHMVVEVTPILSVGVIYDAETKAIDRLIFENPKRRHLLGRIYSGRIAKVVESLGGAFVDLGLPQSAFIRMRELEKLPETALRAGQTIVVQVDKEPFQHKGATLSADIAIQGKYVVYMPYLGEIKYSRQLGNEANAVFSKILDETLNSEEGVIVRSAATEILATPESLAEEILALKARWSSIYKKGMLAPKPLCLYDPGGFYDMLAQTVERESIKQVIVSSKEMKMQLVENGIEKAIVAVEKAQNALWVEKNIPVEALLTQKVFKGPSGISVTIEETEAFTCIDVNSSQLLSRSAKDKAALAVNRAAVQVIHDAILAQNVSGAILIDFLEMDADDRERFYTQICRAYFSRAKGFMALGFTKLGLLEVTRKREQPSFRDLLSFDFFEKDLSYWQLNRLYFDLRQLRHHTRAKEVTITLETPLFVFVSQNDVFGDLDIKVKWKHREEPVKNYQIHT